MLLVRGVLQGGRLAVTQESVLVLRLVSTPVPAMVRLLREECVLAKCHERQREVDGKEVAHGERVGFALILTPGQENPPKAASSTQRLLKKLTKDGVGIVCHSWGHACAFAQC